MKTSFGNSLAYSRKGEDAERNRAEGSEHASFRKMWLPRFREESVFPRNRSRFDSFDFSTKPIRLGPLYAGEDEPKTPLSTSTFVYKFESSSATFLTVWVGRSVG